MILPGVTRDSICSRQRAWGDFDVPERSATMKERFGEAAGGSRLMEASLVLNRGGCYTHFRIQYKGDTEISKSSMANPT
jgi:hypothetical protein